MWNVIVMSLAETQFKVSNYIFMFHPGIRCINYEKKPPIDLQETIPHCLKGDKNKVAVRWAWEE